uniref:Secreted protein n=1 Tax=Haemonchus contortus TaxID=6289 RepID=A0A7I5EBK4_HAECO
MILRAIWALLVMAISTTIADFCGNNRIPFGIEVHKDGHLTLLCSRPNCHEKKYAECPERAESTSCSSNTSWVGGLQKTIDDQLLLQCCEYDLMEKYGQLIFSNVVVRRGEFFEAEERYDKNDEDVIHFDLISNIQRGEDDKGEYYSLTVYRYFCGKIPDTPPLWYLKKNWPYWNEEKRQDS